MIRIVPARLQFTPQGVPFAADFGDIYHSADGGLAQARHVFLAGNRLPQRWRDCESFVIVETGFGLGLNFLATWAAWRASAAPRSSRLHFISAEAHPFVRDDLARLHQCWPELAPLAAQLHAAWPPAVAGFHRLNFDRDRVTLTLLLGEALQTLRRLDCRADAFYLDGFAPARNPAMWTTEIFRELARVTAPNATLATWTVAGCVRDGLAAAGFETIKRPGFGRKREMLAGRWKGQTNAQLSIQDRHALVIGAGLAGTACAARLAARGWRVQIIDRHAGAAADASGNPVGLLRPIVNAAQTPNARLSRSAFPYALRQLAAESRAVTGGQGVLQLVLRPGDCERLGQFIAESGFPAEFVRAVSAAESADLAGRRTGGAGLWFENGRWLNTRALCEANLGDDQAATGYLFGHTVASLERTASGWRALDPDGATIAEAPVVVLAGAGGCGALVPAAKLRLEPVRGQISCLPPSPARVLGIAVCGDGFIAPLPQGGHCAGATFRRDVADTELRVDEHEENLRRAEALLPGFAAGVDCSSLGGRAAFRATTHDRMPVFGELGPGLYVAAGLGARGLLWAPLGAEMIASMVAGEPLPIETDLAATLSPGRFVRRR